MHSQENGFSIVAGLDVVDASTISSIPISDRDLDKFLDSLLPAALA